MLSISSDAAISSQVHTVDVYTVADNAQLLNICNV